MNKTEAEKACRHKNSHGKGHGYGHECSHNHDHEHGRGCSHDHEASHGHEHECGDDHDHRQSHDCDHDQEWGHSHGQECGHDHSHGHRHSTEEIPSVSVHIHDMAVVGSVRCKIGGSYETALRRLQSCMERAARAVESAGGLIGHVKAYAKEEARSCMISITEGEDIQKKDVCGNGIYVESASIVFGVTTEALEKILREAFIEYLA